MNEAQKTLLYYDHRLQPYLSRNKRILDVGAGGNPVVDYALSFDRIDGNAEILNEYFETKSFDVVFSSHCLEHMSNPKDAIFRWFSLVKPGGRLIIIVPDENLYEQGYFPSIFNPDHKYTFTINSTPSWSSKSLTITDLLFDIHKTNGQTEIVELQDMNYDHSRTRIAKRLTRRIYKNAPKLFRFVPEMIWRLSNKNQRLYQIAVRIWEASRMLPFDQTLIFPNRFAQIFIVVRRDEL